MVKDKIFIIIRKKLSYLFQCFLIMNSTLNYFYDQQLIPLIRLIHLFPLEYPKLSDMIEDNTFLKNPNPDESILPSDLKNSL